MARLPSREWLALSDAAWCVRVNRFCARRGALRFFTVVSRLGDGAAWYALMAALIVLDGMRGLAASAHLAATGVVSLTIYKVLKRWTRRPRPFASHVRVHAWIAPLDEYSFPSGHTLHAVAFTVVALAHYPLASLLLIPFTASVAVSRVVLGLHYPSDVLAATALGSVLGMLALWALPVGALLT